MQQKFKLLKGKFTAIQAFLKKKKKKKKKKTNNLTYLLKKKNKKSPHSQWKKGNNKDQRENK